MHLSSPAPLFKRLAALVYDGFIVFSFLLLMTAIALLLNGGHSLLPYQPWFGLSLLAITGGFVSWFWHVSGQTLGMLAWKIKMVDKNQQPLTWLRAYGRFWIALPATLSGISFLYCLIDKNKQSLHDKLAGTQVLAVDMPKKPKSKKGKD